MSEDSLFYRMVHNRHSGALDKPPIETVAQQIAEIKAEREKAELKLSPFDEKFLKELKVRV